MIVNFEKETVLQFKVMLPLYLPFYNRGNKNAYYKYEKFDLDPFTLHASSTSGSPVVLTPNGFFGFLNEEGGRFAHDGKGTLSIICPTGQSLYYSESCDPFAEWQKYNETVLRSMPKSPTEAFWNDIEYCTWNEQKRWQREYGLPDTQSSLNEQLIYDYMERVDKLGLPKGKLTIDDGWDVEKNADGRRIFGNWEINREKFPHMEQLVKDMERNGFIPGLWFSPFVFTDDCELAKEHPEIIGAPYSSNPNFEPRWRYIRENSVLEDYYYRIFKKYIDMGFRKFKLDIAYGNKREMKQLLALIYGIIKEINPLVEVECHIPDIFVSLYCDTVRLNDVSLDPEGNWRGLTAEHYKVCRYSSPGKILNLDHLGTNTPVPPPAEFLEHSHMVLALEGGYPCVSLLPDCYDSNVCEEFVNAVREWHAKHS